MSVENVPKITLDDARKESDTQMEQLITKKHIARALSNMVSFYKIFIA